MRSFRQVSVVSGFVVVLMSTCLHAAPTANEIAEKGLGRAFIGLQKGTAKIRMDISPESRKSRTFLSKAMRTEDGLLRYLIKIVQPSELAGMSFLSLEKKNAYPDQYMYTPSTKILSQIAAGKAKSRFFGSDFIYADLVPYRTDDKNIVELKLLADSKINGEDCYVLQIAIKDAQSPYGQIVADVRKSDMIPPQIRFYDQGKSLLKTMTVLEIGKDSVPMKIQMESVSGSKTVLTLSEVKLDAVLQEKDFTTDAMQR